MRLIVVVFSVGGFVLWAWAGHLSVGSASLAVESEAERNGSTASVVVVVDFTGLVGEMVEADLAEVGLSVEQAQGLVAGGV